MTRKIRGSRRVITLMLYFYAYHHGLDANRAPQSDSATGALIL